MIDFVAGQSHFADHLAPVWHGLDPAERGRFFCPSSLHRHLLVRHNIAAHRISGFVPPSPNPTVVAASSDMERVRSAGRPVIFMEHGSGQSYGDPSRSSYIGALDRRGCILILTPSEATAERQRAATPDVLVEAVGCPKLDAWRRIEDIARPSPPVPAFTHHWDCKVAPETRSGWALYRSTYPEVAARWPEAIIHAHPRSVASTKRGMHNTGLRVELDFADVVAKADVLVCDNSSVMFEWAAIDRPVVVLDLPWYRHDVHHGGRFWEWADVGFRCGRPGDLIATVERAMEDPPAVAATRREIAAMVYDHIGTATPRAVEAIRRATQGEP